ncbi:MAG: PSD1 and planctomycete cytochrome C domain-containing protein [Planctomycetaceae bacterium]|jgi:hypothetical protein|nr:PSD1 and planctomycete cytochrome C domain-containing protein [Planctomycetaceae bacterium]
MNRTILFLAAFVLCSPAISFAEDEVIFSREIQPLLAKHCLLCHGTDKQESGLRLDSQAHASLKLESGERAIVPGHPEQSELLKRIMSDDEFTRMPPEGEALSDAEADLFRRWIKQGSEYESHWSYRPIQKPKLPKVKQSEWVRNPIDHFVLAKLEAAKIKPSPTAERVTLIKRLYHDLTGLPPTPAEVDEFLNDKSPQAYESLVDRLLESPHFGERWGRHWLDKARYADSDGYEKDRPRPNAWRYRDWVIQAINSDLPYDQFTVEQLAGDLLPDATVEQKLATAFHRQTLTNTEGGTDQEEFRVEATFDRTETTAAIWMGLTMTCARCHSHKYDQITQEEYYELFAFFNNANEANTKIAKSEAAMERYQREKVDHDQKVAVATEEYNKRVAELQPQVEKWLAEISALQEANSQPVEFQTLSLLSISATSKATLSIQEDGSILVAGESPDKDDYTIIAETNSSPLTGFKLETLTHDSLGGKGPGRTAHGNFVLSEFQVIASHDEKFDDPITLELASAEADFSQGNFPPENALSDKAATGWAISPQMGKDHTITFFTKAPVPLKGKTYLKLVLKQQYGGKHTIGHFRLSTMTGFDPFKALPPEVAKAVKVPVDKRSAAMLKIIREYVASLDDSGKKFATRLAELKKQTPVEPVLTVRVMAAAKRQTNILHRGDFLQPAEEVRSDAIAVIEEHHPLISRQEGQPADRLDLANWLVDPQHPLTPRVSANQLWAHLFGRGIVPTVNDFGVRGDQPTHPQLLDWLAWTYPREMDWSRKSLIRLIVNSATYRQSSHHRLDLQELDPTNQLFARQNRLRAEAEIVRDLHLAASGLLSEKVGGPSVFPPLPPGVAELSYANNFSWKTSKGEDKYRRGMYTFFKRTSPHPNLISFDCPDSNTTRLDRESSNTPLQALVTLNNDTFTEAAQALANRVLIEGGSSDSNKLTHALRLCIARVPTAEEIQSFEQLLNSAREYYLANVEDAKLLTSRHAVEGTDSAENAAWITTMRMIMNLDEFIVRD